MGKEREHSPIEWFAFELSKLGLLPDRLPDDIYKQAKEMEKEQTKSRAVESYYLYTQYLEQLPKVGGATVEMDFEQWYEQTYGGNK